MILEHGNVTRLVLLPHQLLERHGAQEREDVGIEARPQLVRHATAIIVTILAAAALSCVNRLVHREDDVRHDTESALRAR